MQCGERPKGCEYCWKIEDIKRDNISDRVYKSKIFTNEALNEAYRSDANTDWNLKTLEIAFDSINESKRHKSGVALRFPRIHRIRWDKPVKETDNLEDIKKLFNFQF